MEGRSREGEKDYLAGQEEKRERERERKKERERESRVEREADGESDSDALLVYSFSHTKDAMWNYSEVHVLMDES